MPNPVLVYFAARGRAEFIRLILAEAGVDYTEHPIGQGTAPVNGRPTDFTALKATGQLPFNQVPVWEEPGGFRLAQSVAIANHLARVHGLWGQTEPEHAQVEQAIGGFDDARAELRKLVTAPPDQRSTVRHELLTTVIPRWAGFFHTLLKANDGGMGHLVGKSMTSADLALWYWLELCRDNHFGAALEAFPALTAFFERIGSRPRIAAYLKSPKRHPFQPLP